MQFSDPFSCLNGRDVIAYGTGLTGSVVIPYLNSNKAKGFRLRGATNSRVGVARNYKNTPLMLRSIREWGELLPHATILIATSDLHHQEITNICIANGFQDIIPLTPKMKDSAIAAFFKAYLQQRGVATDQDCISIGDMTLINPLGYKLGVDGDFFSAFPDLVLPPVYDDWDYVVEGPYERGAVVLSPGDVVLDCGANVGIFSAYAASKGCTCYAFEPTPGLLPLLEWHSALNGGMILPVAAALSNSSGTATLYLSEFSCIENSLMERLPNRKETSIQQTTIDDFVKRNNLPRVDFIKADIEGSERQMLAGAQETLARLGPKLAICTYHLPNDKEVLTELILKANPNYKIEHRWKKLYAHIP